MSTTMAVASPAPAPAEAVRSISTGRLVAINSMWFGQGAHWPPINFVLIPLMAVLIGRGSADLLIGRVSAAGNLFALLAPILAGWLSDRTSTRWGRRRPWIVAGTAVNLVGLGWLAFSGGQLSLAFAYMLVQLTFNLAGGAYAAVIPDVVPPADRGRASGMLGMLNGLGAVVGLIAVTAASELFGETRLGIVVGFGAIALILAITTVITIMAVDEPANPPVRHDPVSLQPTTVVAIVAGAIAAGAWISFLLLPMSVLAIAAGVTCLVAGIVAVLVGSRVPAIRGFFAAFHSHDFRWTFATRALVMMGIYTIYPFLALYLRRVIGVHNPDTMAGYWGLAVLAGGILPAVIGGNLSDRLGKRKIFVYASGALQAAVASILLFGLIRSLAVVFVMGVLFGIGYGLYVAVDWAIACDVLPDREKSSGRDMGLWHVAFTLPPALAPAAFAPILHAFNQPGGHILGLATGNFLGFRLVFAGAAIWFVLGTIFVSRIRSVR
ncbi:MAG TPA: MFS transporter [Candidatus Dormibacteraeota bacterium]|nr:MFS transporter [Candidatus Dormibacteraeota bacterium]